MNASSLQSLKKFFKETFVLGLIISLPVYAWVRLIFFEVPFSISEDTMTLFKVMLTGWIIMIAFKGTYYGLLALTTHWKSIAPRPVLKGNWALTAIMAVLLCSMLYACNN